MLVLELILPGRIDFKPLMLILYTTKIVTVHNVATMWNTWGCTSKEESKFMPNIEDTNVPVATAMATRLAFKSNRIKLFRCLSSTI